MIVRLLVVRLPDSILRLPRFSQVLPGGSPSLVGASARFWAKVAKVAPGSPKWFSLSCLPSLGNMSARFWVKVAKVFPGSPSRLSLLVVPFFFYFSNLNIFFI